MAQILGVPFAMTDCTFEHNSASAIVAESGDLTLNRVSFESNIAPSLDPRYLGGALRLLNSRAWLSASSFRDNFAFHGGAIHVDGASNVRLETTSFDENRAYQGDAINVAGGRVDLNRVGVRCVTASCRDATGVRYRTDPRLCARQQCQCMPCYFNHWQQQLQESSST